MDLCCFRQLKACLARICAAFSGNLVGNLCIMRHLTAAAVGGTFWVRRGRVSHEQQPPCVGSGLLESWKTIVKRTLDPKVRTPVEGKE